MERRKRVLITGAAGRLGTALRQHLHEWYDLRLLFHNTVPPDVDPSDQVVVGDVTDYPAMLEACAGVDAIVHLALAHTRRAMTQAERARLTLEVDMPGNYNLFEAARLNHVETFVFASTNHVTGLDEKEGLISRPDQPVRPDSVYGAGKAFGEALGRLYADAHGLRVFCLRVANFPGGEGPGRQYAPGQSRWLSPRDLAQLVWRCIEAERLRWGIFYGVSGGAEEKWDLTNAREMLGYEPLDDGSSEGWGEGPGG